MSWLTDFARPSIKTPAKKGVAKGIWQKCDGCSELLYAEDLPANLFTCPHCGTHLRWKLKARLDFLLDQPNREQLKLTLPPDDPLGFRDRKKYSERLKQAREKGQPEACQIWRGTVLGQSLVVVAQDFDFMAGSMSRGVGETIVLAAETALNEQKPLLCITASGGARMQEGVLSLMQMARTTAALVALKEAGLPYLVLLTDPTTGGVTASFAMLGDVTLAEPGALIGFAGPRVIQQTIGQVLPEGFQTAEYLKDHGMVDVVVARKEQRETLRRLLAVLHQPQKG